jgi:hypothetical protein
MKKTLGFRIALSLLAMLIVSSAPLRLLAQTQGNNAVYTGTSASTPSYSSSFIDASAVKGTSSNTDICAKINAALALIPPNATGAMIDARGVTNLTCPSGDTPWKYPSTGTVIATPSTILLPAGAITIGTTWILPNKTRLIGEGMGPTTLSSVSGVTIIQSSSASTMIQLGGVSPYCPSGICTGVSVEDLMLNGEGSSTTGVLNGNSQEQSYARRVAFYQILGTGLRVAGSAENSGPYTDLVFGTGTSYSVANGTICAAINGVSTRGIHGLTCTNSGSSTPTSGAAVLLGGSGNSLEDITVQGFYDGVKVGSNNIAHSNVLRNIVGGSPQVVNAVVHTVTANAVTDLAVMGVTKGAASYSIEDDWSASGSSTTKLTDSTVALYVMGESASVTHATNSFSRFTTSPTLPVWIQGKTNAPASCSIVGSLYSNTSGISGSKNSWYVCTSTGWVGIL